MIDINDIRKDHEKVRKALLKRMEHVDFSEVLEWDEEKRKIMGKAEGLRAERNDVSQQIAKLKKQGMDASAKIEDMKKVSDTIKNLEKELGVYEEKIQNFLESLPNIPDEDVASGGKENNKVIRVWEEKPKYDFSPKNHIDLVKSLDIIDYDRGVKLGGNGFWLYKGDGALLEWALLNYFIEEHLKDGYEFILPPHILQYQCGYTAGQFPKFDEDEFFIEEKENKGYRQFLLPTSETALVNLHRDEILDESELPKKYFAYTPCFRREAGSHRSNERGMIRGHQFNKVEMFQFTRPEDSAAALEELIEKSEKLVKGLGLHYRVSKLAAKDCSSAMAKTYDIEVWIPSMEEYKEVSSASCANEYQARRGRIRFRRKNSKDKEFVHTLNASGLATSRLIPALVEQLQQADGSVLVPKVLRRWINKDILQAK
ncbi:serine--tRNA ligase [Sporosalibacterium faouarense]|uniref:serine--tRNA ligase n=1 Tax=Sporosalibacterium faouarense TaxID=516123 RepID=UPI00141CD353|nr:serine--tRNA ligase [Sporosalibacterium faouarense]MTI48286.1 serine--tRNA ligase [Bacillota bacterium]